MSKLILSAIVALGLGSFAFGEEGGAAAGTPAANGSAAEAAPTAPTTAKTPAAGKTKKVGHKKMDKKAKTEKTQGE